MTIKRNQRFKFANQRHDITYKIYAIRKADTIRTPIREYRNTDSDIKAVYYVEVNENGKECKAASNILLEVFEDRVKHGEIIII